MVFQAPAALTSRTSRVARLSFGIIGMLRQSDDCRIDVLLDRALAIRVQTGEMLLRDIELGTFSAGNICIKAHTVSLSVLLFVLQFL